MRNLTIVGETTKRLSPNLRRAHPEVPWHNMASRRDRQTHDYLGITYGTVRAVAHDEVPKLLPRLAELASRLRGAADEQTKPHDTAGPSLYSFTIGDSRGPSTGSIAGHQAERKLHWKVR